MNPPFTPGKQALIRKLIKVSGSQNAVLCWLKWIMIITFFYVLLFKLGFDSIIKDGVKV